MAKTKTDGYGNYVGDAEDRDIILGSLPPIAGTWFFTDPTSGLAANDGLAPGSAKANLFDAEALTVDGNGDGLAVFSRGSTSAGTTSYITAAKTISKNGLTIKGISSENIMFGRARVANDGNALASILTVSGDNNKFENLHFGNFGSGAAALGCLIVSGNRNHFKNCHFVGAGHATPGAETGAFDVKIDGGQENFFEGCVLGTDTIIRAAANGNLIVDGGAWRNRFKDCIFISYSATAGKGHINIADAAAMSGWMIFENCLFLNWNENGLTLVDACVIGTKPTSGQIMFNNCGFGGFTAVAGAGMSGCVYVANSAVVASGAGGIATTM
jgi:hypothetical protein